MDGQYFPADVPKAGISSRSATSEPSATPSKPAPVSSGSSGFPKSARILRSRDFRKVYDEGSRFSSPYFTAFRLFKEDQWDGPKAGFTVSRAMGKAVVRNRMRRKMREAVRMRLSAAPPQWSIVFNPRKAILNVKPDALGTEVDRLLRQCVNS